VFVSGSGLRRAVVARWELRLFGLRRWLLLHAEEGCEHNDRNESNRHRPAPHWFPTRAR
jgi:hypothetical protein